MKKLNNKKGFTLVELVVVMVILGILMVILIPRITGIQDGAKKTACQSNLRILDSATALWVSENPTANTAGSATLPNLTAYIDESNAKCPAGGAYAVDATTKLWDCTGASPSHSRKTTTPVVSPP